jgi:hypothetical protein
VLLMFGDPTLFLNLLLDVTNGVGWLNILRVHLAIWFFDADLHRFNVGCVFMLDAMV